MKTNIPVIIFIVTSFIIGIASATYASERVDLVKAGAVGIEKIPSGGVRFYNIFK
jgi:hypothetical protein